ncbi:beta-ketoacyl synthase N-terminal-like domain-containing protein, partial [Micromonospora arborensis]|uniref:type I polyketide synthase n=1 Tax=Micromonospora arborensis TaxID=2116518 RepID=UPI00343332B0
MRTYRPVPVAIVGVGCRFPNGGAGRDGYWSLLRDGVDVIREVPADRWDTERFYDPDPDAPGRMYARWGGFLDGIDGFDAGFFGVPPHEARQMDPQQRILLEVAWEALEDAGIPPDSLLGSRTAVYTGALAMDYFLLHTRQAGLRGIDAWYASGKEASFGPGRLSYLLGLHGPSLAVNTACSSSLVAVHLGVQSLRSGEADLALAGGVNVMLTPELTMFMCKVGAISPAGRCRVFDAAADGMVRGEGAGVVVLKRLDDALADGDDIIAVVRGTAVNHDGPSAGLTVPNGAAQRDVITEALRDAGVTPAEVGYVEAHGTGTPLGDPIEMGALARVYGADREPHRPLLVGSVKTNLGHTDGAAGVAGLVKTALAIRHGLIPPHLHFGTGNPGIRWKDWPVRVPTELTDWADGPRLAGVSAFGLSGTNAHVVLAAAPAVPAASGRARTGPMLLPLSARSPSSLEHLAAAHRDRLGRQDDPAGYASASGVRRTHHRQFRLAVVGDTAAELAEQLADTAEARIRLGAATTPGVCWVFSGQGQQRPGMGLVAAQRSAAFRDALAACDEAIGAVAGWSVLDVLRTGSAEELLRTETAQPVVFALQVALAALWRSWGIVPDAIVGHSMGEIAAAHVAGALDLATAARIIVLRGRVLQPAYDTGRMLAVRLPAEDAVTRCPDGVVVAAVNGPESVVLSGPEEALMSLAGSLADSGVPHRLVPGRYAFHHPALRPHADRLVAELGELNVGEPAVPVFRSTPGDGPLFDAAYWGRNVCEPVRFHDAVRACLDAGPRTFLELGPHGSLLSAVTGSATAAGAEVTATSGLRTGQDEWRTLLEAAAALYRAGHDLDFAAVQPDPGDPAGLPTYPWHHSPFWFSADARGPAAISAVARGPAAISTVAPPPAPVAPAVERTPTDVQRPDVQRPDVQRRVHRTVAAVLGVEPAQVPTDRGFAELGMDSLTAVELRRALQREFGAELPSTVAIDHPTVTRLARELARRLPSAAPAAGAVAAGAVADRPQPPGAAEPIAVVGLACRFPGAVGPDAFWESLLAGADAIGTVPDGRFEDETPWRGGFLDGVDRFDARFFRIPPREARALDPQQRIFLEVAWEAIEDAGIPADTLADSATGVFVGLNSSDYQQVVTASPDNVDMSYGPGVSFAAVPGRLAHFLQLRGPSLAVDTACSSSLVAVHLACRSLRAGESSAAIVGGVNLMLRSTIHRASQAAGALAPDGRCKTFDAAADGYTRGEGCGVVVLKPLSAAVAQHDRVLAVILGSAVNQDGASSGFTVPSGPAQEELIRTALRDAGVRPAEVGYLEAHGTGTPLGDPIELQAAGAVLADGRDSGNPCRVASVKTNIGHLEAAAGIAGLIKTVLAVRTGEIPPHLHFSRPSDAIPWRDLPFEVPVTRTTWTGPRIAGVSAFGFTGTNAHLVVAQPPDAPNLPPEPASSDEARYLLPLYAPHEAGLRAQAERWRAAVASADAPAIADLCYTAGRHRTTMDHRAVVTGRDGADLTAGLAALAAGESADNLVLGSVGGRTRRLAFVYSGHGSQWAGMGRALLAGQPVFRETVRRCDERVRELTGWSVHDALAAGDELLDDRQQLALFAVQAGLTDLWRHLGVRPDAVIGHSVGEVAAAYAAGAYSLADATTLACRRAETIQRLIGRGAMVVVGLPESEVAELLANLGRPLWIAVVNGGRSTVVAGERDDVAWLSDRLRDRNVFCRPVRADGASHCPLVEPHARELAERLADLRPAPDGLPFFSSVAAGALATAELSPQYWARNVREPVRFAAALAGLRADDVDAFVEISPHPLLLDAVRDDDAVALPSLVRERDPADVLLETAAGLHVAGVTVDWRPLVPAGRRTAAPRYAWEHRSYWVEHRAAHPADGGTATRHPLLRRWIDLPDGESVGEAVVDADRLARCGAGAVGAVRTVPGALWLELAAAAAAPGEVAIVTDVRLPAPVPVGPSAPVTLSLRATPTAGGTAVTSGNGLSCLVAPYDPATVGNGTAPFAPQDAVAVELDDGPGAWRRRPLALAAGLDALAGDGWDLAAADRVLLLRDPGPALRVAARVTGGGDDEVVGDLHIADDAGDVLAAYGVRLRRTPVRELADADRDTLTELVWQTGWRPRSRGAEPVDPPPVANPDAAWLILADRGGVGEALAAQLEKAGERATVVFRPAPEALDIETVEGLVHELGDGPGCRGAVLLWGLDIDGPDIGGPDIGGPDIDGPDIDGNDAAAGVYATVHRLLGALAVRGGSGAWIVTRGGQHLTGDRSGSPHQVPLWPLARCAALHHPKGWGGLLDLDPRAGDPQAEAGAIRAELHHGDGEDHVALRAGRRLVARVEAAGVVEPGYAPVRLDRSGAYLVAAADPGVGPAVAGWLAGRGARHIVLTVPDAAASAALDHHPDLAALRPAGTDVRVRPANLADADAAEALCADLDRQGLAPRGLVWLGLDWALRETPPTTAADAARVARERAGVALP